MQWAASKPSMIEKEEKILITAVINGEQQKYSILVDRYKDYSFSIAVKIIKDHPLAEEIVMDAFIKAYQNLHKFNFDSKFSTWLYRIVVNTTLSYKRKTKLPTEEIVDYDLHLSVHNTALEDQDRSKFIRLAIDKLSDTDAALITLFYLNECSLIEVGKIMSIPVSTVKVKLFRARKRMARMLTEILQKETILL